LFEIISPMIKFKMNGSFISRLKINVGVSEEIG
jgi:hypothetical protein